MIFYGYIEICYTMISINTLNLGLNKSKAVYSMFIPLLVEVIDEFRSIPSTF